MHLIYLGGDAFGILKPKFEWKVDVRLGHIEMIEPPDKPLQDKTDETLSKESSVDNIVEVKEEPVDTTAQLTAELSDVTDHPPSGELPDATRNLIVALPPDMQLSLDTDIELPPTVSKPDTIPCSVKLYRCDTSTTKPLPQNVSAHIEVNVVVKNPSYDLRPKDVQSGNKATSTTRSRCSASQNVSYVDLFHESSSEDTASESTVQPLGAAIKRELSHYRLAAHKYMLASRRGIISGPRVRTHVGVLPIKGSNCLCRQQQ